MLIPHNQGVNINERDTPKLINSAFAPLGMFLGLMGFL